MGVTSSISKAEKSEAQLRDWVQVIQDVSLFRQSWLNPYRHKLYMHHQTQQLLQEYSWQPRNRAQWTAFCKSLEWRLNPSPRDKIPFIYNLRHFIEGVNTLSSCSFPQQLMYAQKVEVTLGCINDIPFQQALYMLQASLRGFQALSKQIGCFFRVYETMIFIDRRGKLLVWANKNISHPLPEDCDASESKMVWDIITNVEVNSEIPNSVMLITDYICKNSSDKKRLSFQEALNLLGDYIDKYGCIPALKVESVQSMLNSNQLSQNHRKWPSSLSRKTSVASIDRNRKTTRDSVQYTSRLAEDHFQDIFIDDISFQNSNDEPNQNISISLQLNQKVDKTKTFSLGTTATSKNSFLNDKINQKLFSADSCQSRNRIQSNKFSQQAVPSSAKCFKRSPGPQYRFHQTYLKNLPQQKIIPVELIKRQNQVYVQSNRNIMEDSRRKFKSQSIVSFHPNQFQSRNIPWNPPIKYSNTGRPSTGYSPGISIDNMIQTVQFQRPVTSYQHSLLAFCKNGQQNIYLKQSTTGYSTVESAQLPESWCKLPPSTFSSQISNTKIDTQSQKPTISAKFMIPINDCQQLIRLQQLPKYQYHKNISLNKFFNQIVHYQNQAQHNSWPK